jgi:hypothetical protein
MFIEILEFETKYVLNVCKVPLLIMCMYAYVYM